MYKHTTQKILIKREYDTRIHVESNNLSIYIEISNMQRNCLKILNIEDFEIFCRQTTSHTLQRHH